MLDFPTDRPHLADTPPNVAEVTFMVAGSLIRQLRSLQQRFGSLQSVLLSAYLCLLKCVFSHSSSSLFIHRYACSRWTGQSGFVVGVPLPARPRPDVDGIIGLFEHVIPVRVEFEDMVR